MTREKAIEILKRVATYEDLVTYLQDYAVSVQDALLMAIKALEQDPCEDAISRQAVLDEMYRRKADGDAITAGFIKGLPSVTPVEKQEPCEDVISRQSAISLASDLKHDLPDDDRLADMVMAHNEGILEYQTQLSLLPSVKTAEKVGHWISNGETFRCSECGEMSCCQGMYCNECGAKMEVEE